MQPSVKNKPKMSSPLASEAVNATARGKGKVVTTKRSRGRQTASPYTAANTKQHHTRRRVAGIRRDLREAKGALDAPPPQWRDRLENTSGEHDAKIEIVRTETCSPALSALVMATARGRESNSMWEGPCADGRSIRDEQNGHYRSVHSEPASVHHAPGLLYPTPPSTSTSPPSQDQPMAIDSQVQAIEGLVWRPTRLPSCTPRILRPRHQYRQPFSPSPHSMTSPPPGASSIHFTSSRPSILARSMSWVHCPLAPSTEQAASACAGATIQATQAPSQEGYTVGHPYPIRMFGPLNRHCAVPLISNTYSQSTISNH
jgi:hypothetical protein